VAQNEEGKAWVRLRGMLSKVVDVREDGVHAGHESCERPGSSMTPVIGRVARETLCSHRVHGVFESPGMFCVAVKDEQHASGVFGKDGGDVDTGPVVGFHPEGVPA